MLALSSSLSGFVQLAETLAGCIDCFFERGIDIESLAWLTSTEGGAKEMNTIQSIEAVGNASGGINLQMIAEPDCP